MRAFYLHGFASSAQSTKAAYFGARFAARGVVLQCPDFNAPDFQTMTMSRMLDQLDRAIGEPTVEPVVLIGSSLGGALAVLAASRFGDRVSRMVLLAPAVMFAKPGHHLLTPERIAAWRAEGAMPFFHYGAGAEQRLDYTFYEDSVRYDPYEAQFTQPTLVFQGRRDASVDPGLVEAFAAARPHVALVMLDDDHQLIASLPRMWNGLEAFLGLA